VWRRANNPILSEKIKLLKRQQYKIVDKLLMPYVPSGKKRISKSKVSNLKNQFYINANMRRTNSPMKTNKKEWPMCKLSSENINMMSYFAIRVTGPNGIMVAHKFCDIFFYEKKTSDINI
jgi:hypothetical protein